MPVTKCSNGKYKIGDGPCMYTSKENAEKAEAAYYASQDSMEKKKVNTTLVKEVNEDEMTFTSIVLKADYRDDDGENQDYWPKDVVKQAAYDFMLNCQQGNLHHVFDTDLVKVVASYPSQCRFPMGCGFVDEGDWVMTVKVFNRDLWEKEFKSGNFKGYSVGCSAIVEIEGEE